MKRPFVACRLLLVGLISLALISGLAPSHSAGAFRLTTDSATDMGAPRAPRHQAEQSAETEANGTPTPEPTPEQAEAPEPELVPEPDSAVEPESEDPSDADPDSAPVDNPESEAPVEPEPTVESEEPPAPTSPEDGSTSDSAEPTADTAGTEPADEGPATPPAEVPATEDESGTPPGDDSAPENEGDESATPVDEGVPPASDDTTPEPDPIDNPAEDDVTPTDPKEGIDDTETTEEGPATPEADEANGEGAHALVANTPPVANDDSYATDKGVVLTVGAGTGLLANDTDDDGDTLSAFVSSDPLPNGTLSANGDGSFTYTPNPGFAGVETFVYEANDGTLTGFSDPATVTITVNDVSNRAPVAVDDVYDAAIQGRPMHPTAAFGLLPNDSDLDGDTLVAALQTPPSDGTLTLNPDGSFVYTADATFVGIDSFTYAAFDGVEFSNVATVTIFVVDSTGQHAPVANNDSFQIIKDLTLHVGPAGILSNDTDLEFSALSVASNTDPQHGDLFILIDGSFDYTPDPHFTGVDTFTYQAFDAINGDRSNVATVTITVLGPANHLPVAVNDAYLVAPNHTLNVAAPGVLLNDIDADGDTLISSRLSSPSHGTITTSIDGSFSYIPNPGFTGVDSFSYVVLDAPNSKNAGTTATAIIVVTDPAGPHAPVAVADAYTTAKDVALTIGAADGVLANDVDPDPFELAAVPFSGATAHGTVTLATDGSFVYTPTAGFVGTDTFTYQPTDGIKTGDPGTVTITVLSGNRPPVATADFFQTQPNTPFVFRSPDLVANDTDPDGDALNGLVILGTAAHGDLFILAAGLFEYFPDKNFAGVDSFTYEVSDGNGGTNTGTVTVKVSTAAPNHAPTAGDDNFSVAKDTVLTVEAPGIFANDPDPDGDELTVIFGTPTLGSLVAGTGGAFTYTPGTHAVGVDTFGYRIEDEGGAFDFGTITITITGNTNQTPVIEDDTFSVSRNHSLVVAAPGFRANDSDPDGDKLVLTVSGFVPPENGVLTAIKSDGSFTYVPNQDFVGTDTFTYVLTDLGPNGFDDATVTIEVTNTAPVANDDSYVTLAGLPLTVDATKGLLANDTDAEGDPLTAFVSSDPLPGGTLSVNDDGSFTYTPNAGFSGVETFNYLANDGLFSGFSNVATVTITVRLGNTTPDAEDDSFTTPEGTELVVAAPGLLANDTDADGDALVVTDFTQPAQGELGVTPDGAMVYQPFAGFVGADTFTYSVEDGFGGSSGATVTIEMTDLPNRAPIGDPDGYTILPDTALVAGDDIALLANDFDPDGDTLTAIVDTSPAHGTITGFSSDGAFTYLPDAGFLGLDGFTYVASDGEFDTGPVKVVISVTANNLPPIAGDDAYTVAAGQTLTVSADAGLFANDVDPDGDLLFVIVVPVPAEGQFDLADDGSFTFTPNPDVAGVLTFGYSVTDRFHPEVSATITFTVTNDPPVGNDDSFTTRAGKTLDVAAPGVLGNDTDANGGALQVASITDFPDNGTLELDNDGGFRYTPDQGFDGTDSFEYLVADEASRNDFAVVTITVTANQPPVAADDQGALPTGNGLTVRLLANDTDADGDPLTVAEVVDAPDHGVATITDGSTTLFYFAQNGFVGTDTITYRATDGIDESNLATVTITVFARIPSVAVDDAFSVEQGTTLNVAAPGFLANDSSPRGLPLSAFNGTPPSHGTLLLGANGSFLYTPAPGFSGTDSFTYFATDGIVASDPATVTITVTEVAANQPPVAVDDSYTTPQETALTVAAINGPLANDTDDGDDLDVSVVDQPLHGVLDLGADDGLFIYTPNVGFFGDDQFTYRASDGTDVSNLATVTITVVPASGPPVSLDDEYEVADGVTLTVDALSGVLANDDDPDGDQLIATFELGTAPKHGILSSFGQDGSFVYTPAPGFTGTDGFQYSAFDGTVQGNVATVTITVSADVNHPPVAGNNVFFVAANESLPIAATQGVLVDDTDEDGDSLSALLDTAPAHGTLTLNPDGGFTYTPDAGFAGDDGFTYRAFDGVAESNLATVTLIVNSRPIPAADSYTTSQDTILTVAAADGVLANDDDPDGDALTARKQLDPAHGSLDAFSPDGSFTYTPAPGFAGIDTFAYILSDGVFDSGLIEVRIVVEPKDDGSPTPTPTEEPTEEPTSTPTPEPTGTGEPGPVEEPTQAPTATPTAEPTEEPTQVPPTAPPDATPTTKPTEEPTEQPTSTPEPTEPTETPDTGNTAPDPQRDDDDEAGDVSESPDAIANDVGAARLPTTGAGSSREHPAAYLLYLLLALGLAGTGYAVRGRHRTR